MNQEPNQTLPTDTTTKYLCAPRPATPEKPSPAKQPRKFREGKIRRAKHHIAASPQATNELPAPPYRCSTGLCKTLPFFSNPTYEEVIGLSRYEAEVKRTVSIEEYRNWKNYETTLQHNSEAFQFKPEKALGGFEPYITSKGATEEWVNTQREKRHRISCEHQGPPRTPHPAAIFVYTRASANRLHCTNQPKTNQTHQTICSADRIAKQIPGEIPRHIYRPKGHPSIHATLHTTSANHILCKRPQRIILYPRRQKSLHFIPILG